jgi:hypothetical protein
MSVSSLALNPAWRDYFGIWNCYVEPMLAPLELSLCHAPRFCVLPELFTRVFPASGKMMYNFHLVPGSLIWGMFVPAGDFENDNPVSVQLTDMNLEHRFFQEPISSDQICSTPPFAAEGYFPPFMLLPCPHPVVGDGLYTFEAWGTPGDTFVMVLGVAEVTDCPVR